MEGRKKKHLYMLPTVAKQKKYSADYPFSSGQNELRDKVDRTLVNVTHAFEFDFWRCCPFGFWIFKKFCKLENKVDFLRKYIGFAPDSVSAMYS